MTRRRRLPRWSLLAGCLALTVALSGCGAAAGERSGSGSEDTLTVFAAASLKDAFSELAQDFERRHDVDVRMSFAGSSTLAVQILRGAPADVYASADREQMRKVRREGLLLSRPETFATNQLVVLVPTTNPGGVNDLRDLTRPGLRLVLAADGVPVAKYTERALAAGESRFGRGFARKVHGNVVSRAADVRAAVNRVVIADADATFAYASDVTAEVRDRVQVIPIPAELNVTATYPMGVLESTANRSLAHRWMRFVLSDRGQQVLDEWGFQSAG